MELFEICFCQFALCHFTTNLIIPILFVTFTFPALTLLAVEVTTAGLHAVEAKHTSTADFLRQRGGI
jgi:hypothetical protein